LRPTSIPKDFPRARLKDHIEMQLVLKGLMHPATPSMGVSPSPERWRFHQEDEYLVRIKMGIHLEISPTIRWIKTLCTGNPSIFHCRVGAPACSTTAKSVTDAKPGPFHS